LVRLIILTHDVRRRDHSSVQLG